ncbi:MAG TPA: methionine--tRNA ligase subunit beta [bacterium]|jgi:methionyl-tRNA synthetase|nr:methionine--tRNA ligase subunit beta [Patescibacteria group bacterium]HNU76538.1 methionine--tRNA ligase subunit beta [bacterium]HPD74083.1 methionine--tRNA ligase subunit beta [bacterium]HRY56551.1 methionine--tRNA ligase subunit beta [Patescibacteria group bacterium]
MNEQKPLIKFDDFSKVDMRIGYVESAEEIEGSDKLIKMQVDFGDMGKRQILAGIKSNYTPADLVGKKLPFVVNIEPRKIMGNESQGMILAADFEDKPVIFHLEKDVSNGTLIR